MDSQRTALVTGGNRGIGYAIVQGLAAQGIQVLLGCRDLAKGQKAAAEIGPEVQAVLLDISERDLLAEQMASILAETARIDILVNNAGILSEGNFLEMGQADLDMSLESNFHGPLQLMQILLPNMIDAGYGRIVNMSSEWGSFTDGLTGPAAYSISKAALNALTLTAAQAMTVPDIKINSMCPGWVKTDMGGDQAPLSAEEGADTAIWLATLPADGPTGGFFRNRCLIPW